MPGFAAPDLVRWWRTDVLGISQLDLARQLGCSPATVSNWETGVAAPPGDPTVFRAQLGSGDALAGLLWAIGTPRGLDPDRIWTNVYPSDARASWIWVRPAASGISLRMQAEWGVAYVDLVTPPGAGGALFWVPLAMPELPLLVRLSAPGWVDFGQGPLPDRVLDVPVIDCRPHLRRVSYASHVLGEVARRAAVHQHPGQARNRWGNSAASHLHRALLALGATDQRANWVEPLSGSVRPLPVTGRAAFARLRQARRLSLEGTATLLRRDLGFAVGAETIRRFESNDDWTPRSTHLAAALDQGLGAAGRLAVEAVPTSGRDRVRLPPFWRGPVWVELHPGSAPTPVRLDWGGWRKDVLVSGACVLSSHCTNPVAELRIVAPASVTWRAGIGRRAEARPIDRNWWPAGDAAARLVASRTLDRLAAVLPASRRPPGPAVGG